MKFNTWSNCQICGRGLNLYGHANLWSCDHWIWSLMDECGDQLPAYMIGELVQTHYDCLNSVLDEKDLCRLIGPTEFLQLDQE